MLLILIGTICKISSPDSQLNNKSIIKYEDRTYEEITKPKFPSMQLFDCTLYLLTYLCSF